MNDNRRDELLDILKALLEEDLAWFELRTPSVYIRVGPGPGVLEPPAHGSAAAAPPPSSALAVTPSATRELRGATAPERARPSLASAGEHLVTAPFAGVFYRRPSPPEPPFVEVGTRVSVGDTVCLVEIMKLFHSVPAGVEGVVAAIDAADGALVEYGEVLMRITPVDPGR